MRKSTIPLATRLPLSLGWKTVQRWSGFPLFFFFSRAILTANPFSQMLQLLAYLSGIQSIFSLSLLRPTHRRKILCPCFRKRCGGTIRKATLPNFQPSLHLPYGSFVIPIILLSSSQIFPSRDNRRLVVQVPTVG